MNQTLSSLTFLLLLLVIGTSTRANLVTASSYPLAGHDGDNVDPICSVVDCGQGTCKASNATLLGYDCTCDPGWKKFQIGYLILPSCILPNCTINFDCSNVAPPTQPPSPPPTLMSLLNDPCGLTWCGNGTCMVNGTGHTCKCNAGSSNLMNLTTLPCLNPCSLGPDCAALGLIPELLQPPGSSPSEVAPPWGPPLHNGSSEDTSLGSRGVLILLSLAAMFLTWF